MTRLLLVIGAVACLGVTVGLCFLAIYCHNKDWDPLTLLICTHALGFFVLECYLLGCAFDSRHSLGGRDEHNG